MATLVIDPGHGGTQDLLGSSANHAVGPGGSLEKELTLDIARRVATRLVTIGHEVVLTRSDDTNRSAAERAAFARDRTAAAFLSIHFNAAGDPTLQGTEVLVRPTGSGRLDELDAPSRRLALEVSSAVVRAIGLPDRGLRPGRWTVLSEALHAPSTARCIVEVGFLTDPAEERRLLDESYRDRIAEALAGAVARSVAAEPSAIVTPQARVAGVRSYGGFPQRHGSHDSYGRVDPTPRSAPRASARSRVLTLDWCTIRHGIIRSAVEEQGFWLDAGGTLRREGDPAPEILEMLTKYWREGVGESATAAAASARASARNAKAWSAAFISWVLRNAGVGDGVGFSFSGLHMTYIVNALRNRERGDLAKPFWFYGIDEQDEAFPEPGDLVCLNRRPSPGAAMSNYTYDGLRQRYWDNGNQNVTPTGASHCDVAIGYQERDGHRFLEVIGGNVGDTVASKLFEVDANGHILNPASHNIFGVVALLECQAG